MWILPRVLASCALGALVLVAAGGAAPAAEPRSTDCDRATAPTGESVGSRPTDAPCAAGETTARSGRGAPKRGDAVPASREVTPDRTDRDRDAYVDGLREQMEEAYQAGLDAYQAGRADEAKEHFDKAVEVIVASDLDLSQYPSLRKRLDEIVRNIADMETDLYNREAEEANKENASPLDSLQDISGHLDPQEADAERRKIQQVVGHVSYDIPIVLNPKVLNYIEAFQTRLRKEFEGGLKRSGMYLPMIKKTFREAGLPEDLAYMAHQESGFKTSAYSRARAKGMWQFMSFTGRKYGLKRDLWVDERADFEKATKSATLYLKDLYARYGDWYLAMAAYNAGEGKIDRAIRRARTKDYWAIARTPYIRKETKYYVPAILASILIDKSPEDYGFDVEIEKELSWDTLEVERATDLQVIADAADVPLQQIRLLNPELSGLTTPPNVSSYTLRVPDGTRRDVQAHLESLPDDQRVSWTRHEVRHGETFASIAKRHKVAVRALIDANPNYAGRRLRGGWVLNVPLGAGTPEVALAKAVSTPTFEAGERVVHRVRKGENLQQISWKYRTTVVNLKRWNDLNGSTIRPGQRLVVYYGEKGDGPPPVAEANGAAVSVTGGRIEYRVQPGDTLEIVARKFSAAVEDLCRWNGLSSDAALQPGDRLWIGEPPQSARPPREASSQGTSEGALRHRVRRGETLTAIARQYDVTVGQVRSWNRLASNRIYAGQVLTIHQN
jgi:membrane-bound lytic murein transglycosylase D